MAIHARGPWRGRDLMRHLLFAVMIAMTGAGCSPDQPEDPGSCYRTGWMEADACNYVLSELPAIQAESGAGVRVLAYLQEQDDQLFLTEHQDGSGVHVAVGEVLDDDQLGQPITWMAGHRVSVHGIYHPDTQILDIHSIGVVEEPGVSKPPPPFDDPPGVLISLKSDQPDRNSSLCARMNAYFALTPWQSTRRLFSGCRAPRSPTGARP